MTSLATLTANDLLELRAAPLLKVYDEAAWSADALSGLPSDDLGEMGRSLAIVGSRNCANAALAMRAAIDALREHVAALYQMADADGLMTTDMLIKLGKRS